MKKHIVLITILSVSLLQSCGGGEVEGEPSESKADSTSIEAAKKVSVFTVKQEVFEHYFEIQGSVKAENNVIVVPEVGGLISQLNVREGEQIRKGQVIAKINSDVVASNMRELEEQRDLAKYMFEKQQSLFDQGVGTELALKQAEGQFKTLEQTIKSLKTQQGKFVVNAPFDGYVEQVFPVQGEMAGPASPIIRLIGLNKMSVKADISESYLKGINENSVAQLRFPALENEPILGLKLKRIGKYVNPVNRTITVEVDVPATAKGIVPNLMSVLRIRDFVDSTALVVPTSIIRKELSVPCVYVVKNGQAVKTDVVLGNSSGDYTVIVSGISEGDKLVNKGLRGLNKEIETIKEDK